MPLSYFFLVLTGWCSFVRVPKIWFCLPGQQASSVKQTTLQEAGVFDVDDLRTHIKATYPSLQNFDPGVISLRRPNDDNDIPASTAVSDLYNAEDSALRIIVKELGKFNSIIMAKGEYYTHYPCLHTPYPPC